MAVLSVNAGSSSLKFALYPFDSKQLGEPLLIGQFERLEGWDPTKGQAPMNKRVSSLKYIGKDAVKVSREITLSLGVDPFDQAIEILKSLIEESLGRGDNSTRTLTAIAHRVVHGGNLYKSSVVVTPEVLLQLATLNSLAPLHQPHNIAGIKSFTQSFAGTPQVACFDTSFHTTLGPLETTFAIDKNLSNTGVRRYGFHGLSYQYISQRLAELSASASSRAILAHLGNGASLCATLQSKSVATTMGFSALDGLMMGTRSGALDPGVLLYLMDQGWSARDIEATLYKKSGLLGVSGKSADVRTLRADQTEDAVFALSLFTHRVVKEMGGLIAVLGGVDLICFSGGIGEHDCVLRREVCERFAWLGVAIDEQLNLAATKDQASLISSQKSAVQVWVVPTDEGRIAAQEAIGLIKKSAK